MGSQIFIATGSEVHVAVAAHEQFIGDGIPSRVVSLPCWELFDQQPEEYRDEVLPPGITTACVAVEQASTLGWDRYVGLYGMVVAMETFGASAPLKALATRYGFTSESLPLAEPTPSGSTGASRLVRAACHPHRHHPDRSGSSAPPAPLRRGSRRCGEQTTHPLREFTRDAEHGTTGDHVEFSSIVVDLVVKRNERVARTRQRRLLRSRRCEQWLCSGCGRMSRMRCPVRLACAITVCASG